MTAELVIITKPVSGDIYINNEYRGSGYLDIYVNEGKYIISFGDVFNYISPSKTEIFIEENTTTKITGEYIKL